MNRVAAKRDRTVSHLLAPLLLFGLALGVRLVGLQWGLPSQEQWYSYHPDERQIFVAAGINLNFFDGDFNPNFFNYPSLYIYLTHFAHLIAAGLGWVQVPPEYSTLVWPYLHNTILVGRFITAMLGAATVPLVYGIGRRLAGQRTGVLAALLMALLPGHVQHSHFATVDVPATFFVALSLWLAARALGDKPEQDESSSQWRSKQLLLSAGAAGAAAATKYNGGLVLVAPLAALYFIGKSQTAPQWNAWKTGAMMLFAAALGFVVGCPYSLLNFREFWGDCKYNGFCYELLVHPREGSGEIFSATGNGWWYHLTFNLPFVMTWPLLVAALLGIACTIVYRERLTNFLNKPFDNKLFDAEQLHLDVASLLMLLSWVIVYFGTLGLSQVRFMRYTLPLLPALCVFAVVGVLSLLPLLLGTSSSKPEGSRTDPIHRLANLITLLLTISVIAIYAVLYKGTRFGVVALVFFFGLIWLLPTVGVLLPFVTPDPRDQAAQFIEMRTVTPTTVGLIHPPWFWTPPLSPQDAPPGSGLSVTASPDGRYRFIVTGFDAARLASEEPHWFVMSEFEWRDKESLNDAVFNRFMSQLQQNYELKATFPNPPLRATQRDFVPHDFLYTNPEVRIYKLKE